VHHAQVIPENEQTMNSTISSLQRAGFTVLPQRDGGETNKPHRCAFRLVGRQPELGGWKKDEGGARNLVVRGNNVGLSGGVEL